MTYQPYYAVSGAPLLSIQRSDWTTGVFDCFSDVNSCIDVYCCPCCANARQWDAVEGRANSLNILILCLNCCFGTTYVINCCVRCNVAARFAIPENSCCSCCWATWFPSCSMCQTHRELTNRGFFPGGTMCFAPPPSYIPAPPPINPMGNSGTGVFSSNNQGVRRNLVGLADQASFQLHTGVVQFTTAPPPPVAGTIPPSNYGLGYPQPWQMQQPAPQPSRTQPPLGYDSAPMPQGYSHPQGSPVRPTGPPFPGQLGGVQGASTEAV